MTGEKITTKKFKGQELQNLLAALGCPGQMPTAGRLGLKQERDYLARRMCIWRQDANIINEGNLKDLITRSELKLEHATRFLNRRAYKLGIEVLQSLA